jgi:sodium transport system ATP-binding protein
MSSAPPSRSAINHASNDIATVISVQGLTKSFPGNTTPALSDFSMSVHASEVVGLLGANGAGKTTLLRTLSTLLRPTAGSVAVAGFDVVADAPEVRARVAAMFGGATGLYDRLTARENIRYFASLNGVPRDRIEDRVDELMDLFGMLEYADRAVGAFSSGMKQRTALARAIVHQPSVLFLDEPTTGLDIAAALVVQDFVLRSGAEGRAVVLSSHNTAELEQVCNRVLVVAGGRLLCDARVGVDFHPGGLRDLYLRLMEQAE